jgi:WD40 repeat protein
MALIRLTGAPIQAWTLEFKPQREGTTADFAKSGIPVPSFHTFSPDHAIDVAEGYYQVLVTTPGGSRTLQEPEINRHINSLFGPAFTPDGHYLLLQTSQPALRIYDTQTWQTESHIAAVPADAVTYFPSADWSRAVIATNAGHVQLWDTAREHAIANLGTGVLRDAAFSPDRSMVAVVMHVGQTNMSGTLHVRIWDTQSGQLVSELQPQNEIEDLGLAGFGPARGLLAWLPDSKYLLTIVKPHPFFTARNLALWDVRSGRYHGDLSGCPTLIDRFIVSMSDARVFSECHGEGVLMWEGEAAQQQLSDFESTLLVGPSLRTKTIGTKGH